MSNIVIKSSCVSVCGGVNPHVLTEIQYQKDGGKTKYLYDLDLLDGSVYFESDKNIGDLLRINVQRNIEKLMPYKIETFGDIDLDCDGRTLFENITYSNDKDMAYLLLALIFLTKSDPNETEKQLKICQNISTKDIHLDVFNLLTIVLDEEN